MSQYTQFTAIVPAQYAELYRQSAASVHSAAQGMFVTPLYTGSEEPTHYISTGLIDVDFIEAVSNPEDFAQAVGVSLAEAQWFKDNFTYSAVGEYSDEEDDLPLLHNLEAVTALGLSLIPQELLEG